MKSIFLILFIFINSQLFSQILINENCAYKNNIFSSIGFNKKEINTENLHNYLDSLGYNKDSLNVYYKVPVKFWIYRQDDGSGGVSNKEIKDYINYLNYYYSINNTGIRFYLNTDITYIDKSKYYLMRYMSQAPFQSMKNRTKGNLNVIIARRLHKSGKFGKRQEYNGTYNTVTKGVIISSKTSTSSLSHEIGHFFGLKHPHEDWKKGKRKQEAVDHSRRFNRIFNHRLICEQNGDGLCDTPAEPDLTMYSDKNCKYTGWNVKDAWGDVYKPSTKNIMSYTRNRECRNRFTKSQIALMLKTAEKRKYSKYWRTNLEFNKKFEYDQFEPDFSKEAASEIFFNTAQTHTFHKIFIGKKRKFLEDTEDWLFFKLKIRKPQLITVKISSVNKPIQNIKVSIYSARKLLKEINIKSTNEASIKLPNLRAGKYFIEIENLAPSKTISSYKIEVKKKVKLKTE